jgi:hypothetical protein
MTKKRQAELLHETNEIAYRSLRNGGMTDKDSARIREIRIERGLLPESIFIQTSTGILIIDSAEELEKTKLENILKITRYCPICKHTTKHSFDGKSTSVCLSKKHKEKK